MTTTQGLQISTVTVRVRSDYDVEALDALAAKTGMELKLTSRRGLLGERVTATLTASSAYQARVLARFVSKLS